MVTLLESENKLDDLNYAETKAVLLPYWQLFIPDTWHDFMAAFDEPFRRVFLCYAFQICVDFFWRGVEMTPIRIRIEWVLVRVRWDGPINEFAL